MTTCDGCGVKLQYINDGPSIYDPPDGVTVEIAPETIATVCSTKRYTLHWKTTESSYNPKLPCIRKAWEKARACPGCGEETNPFEGLCGGCQDILARARQTVGDKPKNYSLDTSLVSTHYPGDDAHELLSTICDVAAAKGMRRRGVLWGQVLGGKRREAHSGMPSVELDDDQRVAVEALGAAIKRFADARYHQGRKDGRDLLGQLASGEASISDFEEQHTRWRVEEEAEDS